MELYTPRQSDVHIREVDYFTSLAEVGITGPQIYPTTVIYPGLPVLAKVRITGPQIYPGLKYTRASNIPGPQIYPGLKYTQPQ
jgi:hypothetical protein